VIGPADEALRAPDAEGGADAVTVSFADPRAGVFGLARLGVAQGEGGLTGSALAVLFREREPVAALARGGLELPEQPDWADLTVGGLTHAVVAPLERWRIAWAGEDQGFELELEAISAPAEVAADDPVTAAGGMAGYEQLVRVTGTVTVLGESIAIDGLGQRGRAYGVADWDRLELTRTVSAWFGDKGGVLLQAMRPTGAEHDAEAVWAQVVEAGEPVAVEDPRLSTTYDGDGHQRRAGLELWVDDESGAVRAAGEVLCGSSLELGALRLDIAFMTWHADGVTGIGRYDLLRKAG
jgi:hypothetical protein